MNKLLLVIDVQADFINENTKSIVNRIIELIDSKKYNNIAFTRFINDKNSIWYKKLNYRGCITAEGQKVVLDTKDYKIFDKKIYSAVNKEFEQYIKDNAINEIYLCGFDTDACIQKTALDLFEKGYNIFVLKDYCMSYAGKELHDIIINNLKRLIGNSSVI